MSLVKYNNNSISAVTSAASIPSGAMTLIKTLTASSSSTLSFVDGSSDVVLDSTYPIYVFKFINIHPSADANLMINFSIDGGSNYNVTKTSTFFNAWHDEANTSTSLEYNTDADLAQSTSNQNLTYYNISNDNDSSTSGTLKLFNPSSTTFVKHFISDTHIMTPANFAIRQFCAGYCNTTSAVDAVQFSMSSGNIDAGDICLYGIA